MSVVRQRPAGPSRASHPVQPASRPLLAGAALTLTLLAAGCSGSSALETFDLSLPPAQARPSPAGRQLVVAEPVALQALQSDRIVVRSSSGSVSFVPGVQWSDRLPPLLQTRMVQAFENAGRAVGRAGNGVSADASLQTEIRFFGISTGDGAEAVVELSARLVDAQSGRILAARVFRATAPTAGIEGKAAAAALDGVLQRLLPELVRWAGGASRLAAAPVPPPAAAAPAGAPATQP